MNKQLLEDLTASIREAGKIHRGEAKPSRRLTVTPEKARRIAKRSALKGRENA
jgi:hypothetical protein